MQWDRISRRHFLQGLGGVTLTLPFLPSLMVNNASAQAAPTTRFIAMMSPHGSVQKSNFLGNVLPSTPFAAYSNHTIHHSTLAPGASGYFSSVFGPAFNSMLPKMNILTGLFFGANMGHHNGGILGNTCSGPGQPNSVPQALTSDGTPMPTIDEVMAYSSKIYPGSVFRRSLPINADNSHSITYGLQNPADPTSNIVRRYGLADPLAIFNSLFNAGTGSASPQNINVVDQVYGDYTNLRGNSRLSTQDKVSLDSHMTFLTDLRNKLANFQACSTTMPPPPDVESLPSYSNPNGTLTETQVIRNYQLMNDVLVAAIRCGSTRIATMNIGFAQLLDAGSSIWHQGMAHTYTDPVQQAKLVDIHKWMAENIFLDLITKLDVPEANGRTYLDNSVVLWAPENGYRVHSTGDLPVILAGSCGDKLYTGKFVDYTKRDDTSNWYGGNYYEPIGFMYNRLLVTLLQAMGLTPADYERPDPNNPGASLPGYGDVVRSGSSNSYNQWRTTHLPFFHLPDVGQPLPIITV